MWNERRLARRAAGGDREAFATIFRRYQQDLYRYCVAILGHPQDAQDALQNTMVKALAALPGERREIELKPWLYRVAHNESIELRRRRRPSEPLEEDAGVPGVSLDQRAADRGRLRDLLADLGELPERQRGALVMRELAGLDFAAIGAALDTSPQAARQVLYEARRGLQQMGAGREMECDAVTAILSAQDGRVARRRDVRAHLRDCPDCRRFGAAIRRRGETLAAIAPLPAVAAAALAKGALSGAAGGGASTGSVAEVAGGATKAASTGAILKSAAGIVAVVAVGAVAADHGHLLHAGGTPAGLAQGRAAVTAGGSGDRATRRPSTDDAGRGGAAARPRSRRPQARASHVDPAAARRSDARDMTPDRDDGAAGGIDPTVAATPARSGTRPSVPAPKAHPAHPGHAARPPHRAHPAHPLHPAHPTHPVHPTHPTHPDHPSHPAHPVHPPRPETSSQPTHPPHPEQSARPEPATSTPEPAASAHPEHPEHPEHPAGQPAEASPPTEAGAAAQEVEAVPDPAAGAGPGQARKEAAK